MCKLLLLENSKLITPFLNISTYSETKNQIKNKLKLNSKPTDKNKIQNFEKLKITSSIAKCKFKKEGNSILTRLWVGYIKLTHRYLMAKETPLIYQN